MREKATKINEMFTYQDYLHLPDDGRRYQIIDGELHMVPAPVPYHQMISMNIERILYDYTKKHGGKVLHAPCDVVLTNIDVVQPDIFFTSEDRLDIIKEKNIQGAPDLVVEILSSYSGKIDKISKTRLYARFEVKEYWIVDPDKKEVTVLRLKGQAYKSQGDFGIKDFFESKLLKGLIVKVSEIFLP
jgi:Uma2 family endonuclease